MNKTEPHTHNGIDSPLINKAANGLANTGNSAVFWFINQGGPGSGGTNYYSLVGASSTEAGVQVTVPTKGTISNLYLSTSSSQPGTGTYVITLRQNGTSSSIVVTISAGGGAAVYSDTSHSLAVNAGDLINIQGKNNATSNAATISYLSFKIS